MDWLPIVTAPRDGTAVELMWEGTSVLATGRWVLPDRPWFTPDWRDVLGNDILTLPTHWRASTREGLAWVCETHPESDWPHEIGERECGGAGMPRANQLSGLVFQRDRLEQAIRQHRDARGDDRCWMDDEALYKVLPEGYTPPARDTAVELERCRQFIACRQHPETTYVSPQRRIEELERELKEARDLYDANHG